MRSVKRSFWVALAVLTTAAGSAPASPLRSADETLAREADWLQGSLPCLRTLLEQSRYGVVAYEISAWLVESPASGGRELACVLWPQADSVGKATWSGPLPRGLRAQLHTHPTRAASGRQWGARPSRQDCQTAKQLKVPVLTVSAGGVFVCRPNDGRILQLLGAGWMVAANTAD